MRLFQGLLEQHIFIGLLVVQFGRVPRIAIVSMALLLLLYCKINGLVEVDLHLIHENAVGFWLSLEASRVLGNLIGFVDVLNILNCIMRAVFTLPIVLV
jgi:hypothetical protein